MLHSLTFGDMISTLFYPAALRSHLHGTLVKTGKWKKFSIFIFSGITWLVVELWEACSKFRSEDWKGDGEKCIMTFESTLYVLLGTSSLIYYSPQRVMKWVA